MGNKKAKRLTIAGMFVALGVSKCFPVQHSINILSATILGPFYSVGIAFSISLLRNILGTGSLLAFPIAKHIMGNEVAGFFFIYPFIISSIGGSIIAIIILRILEKNKKIEIDAK